MRAVPMAAAAIALTTACDPHPCPRGHCDAHEVGLALAEVGATDCGVAVVGADASAVQACMAASFSAGTPFSGVVESLDPRIGAVLLRGFTSRGRGDLRELVGTRQGERTVVHTRACLAASVSATILVCTQPMDGLRIECDCATAPSDASGDR